MAKKRARKASGKFQGDDPATEANEAFVEAETPKAKAKPKGKGFRACDGPSTAYRDGPDGTIEVMDVVTGWIPAGWTDTPANCENPKGNHVEVAKTDPANWQR